MASVPLAVLEASPAAVVAVDHGGLVVYANRKAQELFGYVASEIVDRPIERLIPDWVMKRHLRNRSEFPERPVARSMGIGMDLSGRRKDGTDFPVEISLTPVQTTDGAEVFATIVDITARKEAERALAQSERRLTAVLDGTPNPVVGVDASGLIVYVNQPAEETFGYTTGELLGQPVEMLLPESVVGRHVAHREAYVGHPVARPMGIGLDLEARRKDGRHFPAEISLSPVETAEGYQIFAQIVDITARKTAEAELLQAQKLESIGRLAGGIAHDFNNVLFAINGYAEMLEEDLAPGRRDSLDVDDARRSVVAIRTAGERGATLTAQLLAFSRQQVLSPKVIDVDAAVRAVEPMLRRLIGENVHLALVPGSKGGRIRLDPGQMDQILVNLVVNARDAMSGGGTVTIQTGRVDFGERDALEHVLATPGQYVVLAVSDTGEGMDRETREHIFEPFFTTKERGHGTGLGLATIYGIVQQAGGHVWVYSELGLGAVFKLYFPAVEELASEEALVADHGSTAAVGSVLVVEDEPAVRDMICRLLQRAGYEFETVGGPSEALEMMERRDTPIDVLLSDVVMPEMSGIELAELVLERHPHVGVVLLSGYTEETLDLARIRERGAMFVAKPVAGQDLLRAIRSVCRTARTRGQAS
jgi:PAS domain S-box-containing protein